MSANNNSTQSSVWDKPHHGFVVCLRQYASALFLKVNEAFLIWYCIYVNHVSATSANGTKWVTPNRTMATLWHGNACYVPAICDRNFCHKGPSVRCLDVSFPFILIELFNKHSGCQRFETQWRSCKLTVSMGQKPDRSILYWLLMITSFM